MHLDSTNAGRILEIRVESLNAVCIKRMQVALIIRDKTDFSYEYEVSRYMGSASYFSYMLDYLYYICWFV
jgi:hypothetical protein